jgi:hypothetical protein
MAKTQQISKPHSIISLTICRKLSHIKLNFCQLHFPRKAASVVTTILLPANKNSRPMAHTYNPSDSGGRDQEYRSLKPARQRVCKTLSQKHPSQK